MHKTIFYFVIAVLLFASAVTAVFTAGCAVMDEAGMEGAQPDTVFGPASLAGMWKGESNWDGAIKEIKVWVRKPTVERMVSPTGQAPTSQAPIAKPSAGAPAPAPVWEQVKNTGLVFWGWDIFFKGEEKINFVNIQIIFVEDGQGKLTVVSQTGGTGNAIFVQDGEEKRVELALFHPLFKEIKGRFICEGEKINGSFTLLGKEGVFKLAKDNSKPAENQPR